MAMNSVRRIASEILGVGESKVRFRPADSSKIAEALTREDVRALIKDGSVFRIELRGVSRVRGRKKAAAARKRRRGGVGSRRGTHKARLGLKEAWIAKVRAQRRHLRMLVKSGKMQRKSARKVYLMVKGNAFKGVKILDKYLKDNKLLKGN